MVDRSTDAARSATARSFGATVTLAAEGSGLCLLIGREGSPAGLVREVGGQVVAALGGARLLAMVDWEGLEYLRRHHSIALAGAVSIDPHRFSRFCGLVGINGGDTPNDGA